MAGRTGQVILMLAGLIAWAVQFTFIYGATSTLCGRGWAGATILGIGSVQALVLIATLTATGLALTDARPLTRWPGRSARMDRCGIAPSPRIGS